MTRAILIFIFSGAAFLAAVGSSTLLLGDAEQAPFVVLLGMAQDGGYPQAGCRKDCCASAWSDPPGKRHVVCLAVVDPGTGQRWMIDATPDFREQLRMLDEITGATASTAAIDGIFLSHAHIGHYLGLAQLGREVMGARGIPVYAMPRMKAFLETNGPWDQLVRLGNIALRPLADGKAVRLNERVSVTPILVPHRDEYTETAGFRIDGPDRSVLYITDIDKWERWETRVEDEIAKVDAAFLDGTFYDIDELPGRDMSDIPHPFIVESMKRFAGLPATERAKIRFLHFNHTNPALDETTPQAKEITRAGFRIAVEGEKVVLKAGRGKRD